MNCLHVKSNGRICQRSIIPNQSYCWQHRIIPKELKINGRYGEELKKYLSFLITPANDYVYNHQMLMSFAQVELENDHLAVEWLFPTINGISHPDNPPVIDLNELKLAISNESYLISKLGLSYSLICHHWGLKVIETDQSNIDENSIIDPFYPFTRYIHLQKITPNNDFLERIELLNGPRYYKFTIVLKSLVYHGLITLAQFTLDQIKKYHTFNSNYLIEWQLNLDNAIQQYQNQIKPDPDPLLVHIKGSINQTIWHHLPIDGIININDNWLTISGEITKQLVKLVGGPCEWLKLIHKAKNIDQNKDNMNQTGDCVYTDTSETILKGKAKYILHTIFKIDPEQNLFLIKKCVRNLLGLANHLNLQYLILPSISFGLEKYSIKDIRNLIVKEIKLYVLAHTTTIKQIYLLSNDQLDEQLWPIQSDE